MSGNNFIFYNRSELDTAINLYISNFNLAISTYGDINTWDVSLITDMSNLFKNKTTFNYDISNWNVSNVTNMSGMFDYARAFNKPLNSWIVSKVTNMSRMFYYSNAFNQPLNNWNVANVTNMREMFGSPVQSLTNVLYGAFNQPLNSWNVSNVTDMYLMFYTSSYNQPLNSWNVSNVTDMTNMFTSSFFNQELNNWNVANVNYFDGMFLNNKVFNKDIRTWTVKSTASLELMFDLATAFNVAYPLATSNPTYLFFNYKMLYLNQGWNIIGTSYNSNILDASAIIHNNTIYSMNKGVYNDPITNGQLESTKGYFFKTNNPGYIMTQNLTNFNDSYIDVSVGWNLIGVSQNSAILDPSSVIVPNSISTLDSNNNSQIVTDNILLENKGYFFKSTTDMRLYLQ
jgi:surface protein